MPNWKKVIVSGSDALLNSVTASNGIYSTGLTQLSGSTTLTGSLNITGSTTQIGNNTLSGNTTLSGSIIISGSLGAQPTVQVYGNVTHDGYIRFNPVSTNIDQSISASYIYVSGSTNDLYFTQNGNGYGNTTRLRWLEGNLYTGLLNGGLITISTGSTWFNLSSGSGIIVDLNASLNDNPYPTVKYVNWGNFISQSITYLTSSIQSYIGIDENGQITQQTTPYVNGEYNTKILIGTVLHQNQTTVNASITYPNVAYGYKQRTYDFIKAFGPLKLSGYTIVPSSSLGLTVAGGTAWADGRNYQTDPNNPSYIVDPGTNVSKIFRYYQSGSVFIQDTNGGLGYTVIDPTNYNNNGTLTSISPSTPFTIQRVFWYPNSATKGIVVYYGNAQYASISEAEANLNYETFNEVENTKQNAIYLGAIVIKYNGVFTNANDYIILPGGIFRSVGGSGGGGSVVTTRLVDLSDVNISGPTDGQALVYDSTDLKWENKSFISASISGNAATSTTVSFATTASYVLNAVSSSFASTASYVNTLNQDVFISGSLQTTGSIIVRSAPSLTASIDFYNTSSGTTGGGIYTHINGRQVQFVSGPVPSTIENIAFFASNALDSGSGAAIRLLHYNNGLLAGNSPNISQDKAGGTRQTPTPVTTGMRLGANQFRGYNGTSFINVNVLQTIIEPGATGASIPGRFELLGYDGTTLYNYFNVRSDGRIQLGRTTSANPISSNGAKLFIQSPSSSGTADALYIENSAATQLLTVRDDGYVNISGSLNVIGGITGSLLGTASLATSASFALTSSYLNTLNQDLTFNGNLTLNGTASITYLNVVYETASVIYSSGSNQFGDKTDDTQTLIGRVIVSGSLEVTGSSNLPSITGSLFGTASYATQALSASYAPDTTFPYTGSALITGSLGVTGSLSVSGSFQLNQISLTKTSFDTIANGAVTNTSCDEPLAQFRNFRSMHIKYNIQDSSGGNYRAGTIVAITDGAGAVQYNETTTLDIGDTKPVILSMIPTNSNQNLTLNVNNGLGQSIDLVTEYTML